jgi:hypothetical protein
MPALRAPDTRRVIDGKLATQTSGLLLPNIAPSEYGDAPGNNRRQNEATSQNNHHFGAAVSTIEIEAKQPLYPIHVESSKYRRVDSN